MGYKSARGREDSIEVLRHGLLFGWRAMSTPVQPASNVGLIKAAFISIIIALINGRYHIPPLDNSTLQ